jgi:hypothetical protein
LQYLNLVDLAAILPAYATFITQADSPVGFIRVIRMVSTPMIRRCGPSALPAPPAPHPRIRRVARGTRDATRRRAMRHACRCGSPACAQAAPNSVLGVLDGFRPRGAP